MSDWGLNKFPVSHYQWRQAEDRASKHSNLLQIEHDEHVKTQIKLAKAAEKAALLDWLLTPKRSGREDRPDQIAVSISKNATQALLEFRAWCTPEEALAALKKRFEDEELKRRSWPEDAHDENGEYFCSCVHCEKLFIGYKRRVCCKLCAVAE